MHPLYRLCSGHQPADSNPPTLNYLMAKDPSHLIAIGSYYTDTIHFKLQELSITDETEIDNHPLMQAAGEKLLSLSASEAPTNDLFTK